MHADVLTCVDGIDSLNDEICEQVKDVRKSMSIN